MISAGLLNEWVTPIAPTTTRDAYGSQTITWTEQPKLRARVTWLRGNRAIDVGEQWMAASITVTLRYTSAINERQRLKWGGRMYQIDSVNGSKASGVLTITASRLPDAQ